MITPRHRSNGEFPGLGTLLRMYHGARHEPVNYYTYYTVGQTVSLSRHWLEATTTLVVDFSVDTSQHFEAVIQDAQHPLELYWLCATWTKSPTKKRGMCMCCHKPQRTVPCGRKPQTLRDFSFGMSPRVSYTMKLVSVIVQVWLRCSHC